MQKPVEVMLKNFMEDKMPKKFKCPRGTKKTYRYKKKTGGKQRIGGCMRRGRFVKIKEIKTTKKGKSTYRYPK